MIEVTHLAEAICYIFSKSCFFMLYQRTLQLNRSSFCLHLYASVFICVYMICMYLCLVSIHTLKKRCVRYHRKIQLYLSLNDEGTLNVVNLLMLFSQHLVINTPHMPMQMIAKKKDTYIINSRVQKCYTHHSYNMHVSGPP